jgi:hypothetical protein
VVDRRIEDHNLSTGTKHPQPFGKRALVALRIVEGRVIDDQVGRRIDEGQRVKFGLDW